MLEVSVESSVLDGFGEVFGLDGIGVGEVGDGACDAEDLVVGAGGEAQFVDGLFEDVEAGVVEGAELADLSGGHSGVDADVGLGEALGLSLSSFGNLDSHCLG